MIMFPILTHRWSTEAFYWMSCSSNKDSAPVVISSGQEVDGNGGGTVIELNVIDSS